MRSSRTLQRLVVGFTVAALASGSVFAMSSTATADEATSSSDQVVAAPEGPTETLGPDTGSESTETDGSVAESGEPDARPAPDAPSATTVTVEEESGDPPLEVVIESSEGALAPATGHLADIPVPIVTSPPSGTVSFENSFIVSGTVEPSLLSLDVVVQANTDELVYLGFCSDSLAAEATAWSCELDLNDAEFQGELILTAAARDGVSPESDFGHDSDPVELVVDLAAESSFANYDGFSNRFESQTFSFEGTGPAYGSVVIRSYYYPYVPAYGGEQTVDVCSAQITGGGSWQCTGGPLPNGGAPYFGYAYFEVFTFDYFGVQVNVNGDQEIGGDVALAPPTLSYTLTPAAIAVTATGIEGSEVGVDLYTAEPNGEGYNYGFVDECITEGFADEGYYEGGFTSAATTIDCSFSGLAPGIWNIYYAQRISGVASSDWVDDFVMIPETPSLLKSIVNADRSVRFEGTGTPGDRVIVRKGSSTVSTCSVIVGAAGTWACTGTPSAGTATFRAVQQSVGFEADPYYSFGNSYDGFSALSAARTVTVPSAPNPVPPVPLALPPVTPGLVEVAGVPSFATSGTQLEIIGNTDCIEPIVCDVDVDIFSTPQRLGSTVTEPAGTFSLVVTVPEGLEPGDHTIVVTVTPRGGVASSVSQPITIAAPPETDVAKQNPGSIAPDKADSAAAGDGGSSSGSGVDRADSAAPSAISDSIPTLDRIFRTPLAVLAAGGLALAILLLVAFPAELLNSTLASNTQRLGRWYGAVERGVDRATEWFASVTRTRAAAAALLVVLTSLIFGFVDPEYGFDPVSVRMTVSLAIGLFIVTYVSSWISGAIIRRVWSIETRVSLQPAALVFAVIGVVVARILEFSPGFLIGLVIGLDLVTRVGAPHRVRAILTNIGVIVGLAVASWVGFSILSAVMTGEPTMVGLLISDALVATTAEGLTAALAALLPLGFLDGHEVFRRSKLLWAGSFAAVATVFSLIVLPTTSGETDDVADVGFWMLVMVIFAVVTLTLWALLHFTGRGESDDDELVEQPVATSR